MTFLQVIEQLRLTLSIRLVEPEHMCSHPESPGNHSPGRSVYAIRGARNTNRDGGLLYRTGIKKRRKVENANTPACVGHFVETSPGEQVMTAESAATDGGSPAARAVREDVAAGTNNQGNGGGFARDHPLRLIGLWGTSEQKKETCRTKVTKSPEMGRREQLAISKRLTPAKSLCLAPRH